MRKMILTINSSSKLHFSSLPKSINLKENYIEIKSNKMENKRKIKKEKIYKSLQLPRSPVLAEVVHNALDGSIYRLSNVVPHFNNCVMDPQKSCPNQSLYRNIESYIPMQFSVQTYSLGFSWILSRQNLIMSRHNFDAVVLFLSQ